MSNLSGPLPTTSGLALPNVLRKPPGELWTLAHRVPGSSCAFLTSRTMLKTAANLQTQPVLVSVLQAELPQGSQLAELASRRSDHRGGVQSSCRRCPHLARAPCSRAYCLSKESCDKHRYTFEYPCECISGSPAVQRRQSRICSPIR